MTKIPETVYIYIYITYFTNSLIETNRDFCVCKKAILF